MKTTELSIDELKKRIGNNIRIMREFKKIGQAPLCERIDKSQPTLSRYENGQASMTIDIFFEICQYLDVSPDLMISKDLSFTNYSYCINDNSKSFIAHNTNTILRTRFSIFIIYPHHKVIKLLSQIS